jgi:hypothetical protein
MHHGRELRLGRADVIVLELALTSGVSACTH